MTRSHLNRSHLNRSHLNRSHLNRSHRLAFVASAATTAALALGPCRLTGTELAPSQGLDIASIDRSIAPGDDFFRYANGLWLEKAAIPADRSAWGPGQELTELTAQRTAGLIRAGASSPVGSEARKISDYYSTFMDEARIEKLGLEPLQPGLRRIDSIRTRADLARALGETLRADVDVLNDTHLHTGNFFGLWVAQDLDDPTRYSPFLLQGGLGMPDRDYYLDPSPGMEEIRARYHEYIRALFSLVALPGDPARAERTYDLERRIASAHWTRAQSEQVLAGDNHWRRADLDRRAPGLDWTAFLTAAGLASRQEFIVWQPSAVTAMAALVASEPLETWKDYLRFHLIDQHAQYLPRAFVSRHFEFHEHVLSGTPRLAMRWKRAVEETNAALGEAVGKLYVARYFQPAEKRRAEAMVRNLLAAFAQRLDRLQWMTPATREKAKAKLATLKVGVGYPDTWRDYSALEVITGDAFGNAERAQLFEYRRNLAKLGRPVDRGEWVMNPQLVNAVNLPAMNALNFPAAILQPPYFDPARDPEIDYGATGATIGHEISHSFDDQGALFDAAGRLRNWWTAEDLAHFRAAGAQLVEQFDHYQPFPGVRVNGKQTLSENIADVAGLSVAYDAWHLSSDGRAAPAVAGFSGDQLFFLGYAQSWREKIREPALRQQIVTDGHAPDEYRADTVRNLDAWYEAFSVHPGEKLYLAPAQRVRVW